MSYIEIDKYEIPYEFEIVLNSETWQFEVFYNSVGDFFSVNLYKNHILIRYGEKIVYGVCLFDNLKYLSVPQVIIKPMDSTKEALRITYKNMNEDVFLYVLD